MGDALWAGGLASSLVLTLALMGLASTPHCALMCGAPCAAALGPGAGQGRAVLGFQLGRLIGYAAAGAVVAASLGLLREAAALQQALRPLWLMLQLGLLVLGLWLLLQGRWPGWLGQRGVALTQPARPVLWQRAGGSGLLWFAWPCGVLQGALLVAALAPSPWAGALAMAAFAIASSPGLLLAPLALRRLSARQQAWAPRLAGLMLAAAASWALGHGLWARIVALCT